MAISFVMAAKKFFGQKDGQTLMDFSKELKFLTPKDREDLRPALAAELHEEVTLD